ncbi:MAG: prolipoprotein diacylglyceryl transferase [Phycisphaeraceae bacterium]|nr:prolipoprotein diacylglyceryl transferase [Phycisphaeraceae bacterium]
MTLSLAAFFHDLSPFILRLGDSFGLRWYGMAYVVAFVIAFVLMRHLARRGKVLIPPSRIGDAMVWVVAGTVVGGRLGYCLVYGRELFTDFSSSFPFWGVLAINKGGMASHGGLIGLILAAWRISRGFRPFPGEAPPNAPSTYRVGVCPPPHVMDVLAFCAPPGLLLGRIANFINGELLGRIVTPPGEPNAPWWSVRFPQELLSSHAPPLSASQQLALEDLLASAAPEMSPARALDHVVENAAQYRAQLEPLLSARVPSQLLQGAAEGLILGIVLLILWARPRKPGVIAATFVLVYGILRIITEVWRLPDPQFNQGRPLGLSRGQWLSVPMVAVGALWLWWSAMRPNSPKLGGWLSQSRRISTM